MNRYVAKEHGVNELTKQALPHPTDTGAGKLDPVRYAPAPMISPAKERAAKREKELILYHILCTIWGGSPVNYGRHRRNPDSKTMHAYEQQKKIH